MSKYREELIAYIHQDINNMSTAEVGKVYKFIRRSIIVHVEGYSCNCDGGLCKLCREKIKNN